MTPAHLELARRYAFTFFFRAAIPFPRFRWLGGGPWPYRAARPHWSRGPIRT